MAPITTRTPAGATTRSRTPGRRPRSEPVVPAHEVPRGCVDGHGDDRLGRVPGKRSLSEHGRTLRPGRRQVDSDVDGSERAGWTHAPTAIWTGTEMIVWGGDRGPSTTRIAVGATTPLWTLDADFDGYERSRAAWAHTAVWTGTEMIVWGGNSAPGLSEHGWSLRSVHGCLGGDFDGADVPAGALRTPRCGRARR